MVSTVHTRLNGLQIFAPTSPSLRRTRYAASTIALLIASSSLVHAQSALPQGGNVVAGSAAIQNNGANTVVIEQTSQKAVINWNSFSIGQDASVTVNQPNAGAALLNRVTGGTSSTIAGSLSGMGQVFLINPNGIAITSTGTVNAGGGFVASTLDVADTDFMNGTLNFRGSGGTVSNGGAIRVGNGGFAALLGGQVSNSGSINVPLGKIGMGSGQRATLDLSGDGFLQVALPASDIGEDSLIQAGGYLSGGRIEIRAATVSSAMRNAVNVPGELSAKGAYQQGGVVILDGGEGGGVQVSGKIDASEAGGTGGTIAVGGQSIVMLGADIDASGASSGGRIWLGGGHTGESVEGLTTATSVMIDAGSSIKADATASGSGGDVVVWSNDKTDFQGAISAQALGQTGDGGEVEVSGGHLAYTGSTNLLAAHGATGTLLLDPYNITISTGADSGQTGFTANANDSVINTTTLTNALASANVTVSTGTSGTQNGDITVANAISWTANTTLTLNAAGNIAVNANITKSNSNGSSGLTLIAGGTGGVSGSGNLAIRGTLNVNVNNAAGAGTLAGVLSGNTSLNKGGSGTLTLTGVSTFTGTAGNTYVDNLIRVNAGKLQIGGAGSLGSGDYGGSIGIASGATLAFSSSANQLLRGFIAGVGTGANTAGALSKDTSATSTLTLLSVDTRAAGANNITTIDAGTMKAGGSSRFGLNSAYVVTNGGILDIGGFANLIGSLSGNGTVTNSSSTVATLTTGSLNTSTTFSGTLQDGASGLSMRKNGTGTMTIVNDARVGAGTTNVTAGTWQAGSNAGFGLKSAFTVASGATLDVNGYQTGVGSLDGAGTVTNGRAAAGRIAVGGIVGSGASVDFSGVVTDGVGTIAFQKYGTGEQKLSGANTYTGTTTVLAGNINLSGSLNPTSGTVNVSVSSGATFGGAGVVTATTLTRSGAGTINLTGANKITTVTSSGTAGGFTLFNAQSLSLGSMTSTGPIVVNATGGAYDLTLGAGKTLSSTATGNAITLAADGNFLNNSGAGAVSTPNGRWQVFSAAPSTDVFGGLNSNNAAVWNATYASSGGAVAPTGNRYVFVTPQTLTFTPQSTAKTYGDDATAAVASCYTVSGYASGLTGVYLADTAATTFTGSAGVTSPGATPTANAGSYTIDAAQGTLTAVNGYQFAFGASATLTVNKAALTVTASDATKTYDGLAFNGGNGVTYAGFVNGETSSVLGGSLAYGGSAQGAINAGSYGLTASGLTSGNYAIGYTAGTLTVGKAALTVTANDATKTYDGLAFNGGNGVTYAGFVNGETSSVLGGSLAYGGSAQGAINAGSYGLTASGLTSGNYAIGYTAGTLTVGKAALTVTANDATKTYDGLAFNGGNGVTYAGFVNGETSSVLGGSLAYGGSAQGAINAGSYGLTASGLTSGNYAIGYTAGTLTVGKAALTVTANDATKTYDGLAFNGGNGVTYAGFVNGETSSVLGGSLAYGGSAQGAINAGSYGLTASGLTSGNYAIGYTAGTLTVGKAALTVTANDAAKTYDGLAFNGGNGVTYAGFVNGETSSVLGGTLAYGGSAQGAINAGSYGLSASGLTSGNYTISYTAGTLNVGKAALTVTASDASKTYNGLAFNGGNGVTYAGFVNGETSSVLGGSLAYGGSAQGAVNAGSYGLTASGLTSGNYTINYTAGTLNVGKAALTITASDAAKTYNGLAFNGGNGVTYAGFVNGETSSVLGGSLAYGGSAQGAINAGTYGLSASGLTSGNYTINYTAGTLNVGKAALTITASDAAKTYDGLAFNGGNGVTYAGFVNGETSSVLGGSLAYGGSSQGAINAGTYGLSASGLTSGNYTINYTAGTLNVGKAALTVTASDAAKTYDGLAFNGGNGVTYAGFVNGETSTVLGGTLAYSGSSQGAINAGSYGLSASGLTSGNYTINYTAGTLNVGKAALTVTASDAAKTYDGLAFNGGNGVTYAGFVNGETSTVLGGTLAYSGSSQGAINAGSYGLSASGLTSGNYTINYTAGTLNVGKAALTVTANNDAKFVIEADAPGYAGVSYSGFVNGETASVLSGTLSVTRSDASTQTLAGSYTGVLNANGLVANNYTIRYTAGDYTIVPSGQLLVRVTPTTTAYGAASSYGLASAAYYNGTSIIYLTSVNDNGNGRFTVNDGSGGSASFTVTPTNARTSSAGYLAAGSYQLGALDTSTTNAVNFSNKFTLVGSQTVTPMAVSAVANAGFTKTYDGTHAMSGLAIAINGLLGNDVASAASNTGAFDHVDAGTNLSYEVSSVVLSGSDASNYYLSGNASFTGSNGRITPRALTVTANDASKTYDGLAFNGGNGVTYAGFVNGETSSVLGGTLAYSGSSQGAINAGTYGLSASGLTSGNYTISYTAGTLNVGKAALTVTASDASKTYDGLAFNGGNGVTYTGFVNGETSSVLGGTLAYGGSSQGAINAGTYGLSASGLTSGNYTINYTAGTLNVGKAALIVTASDASKTYDGLAFNGGNGVTYAGFVNGETSTVLGGTLAYSGSSQGAVNAGTYGLSASGLTSGNYSISYTAGTLNVGKAALTVTASDAAKTYDGLAFNGGNGVTYAGFVNGETSSVLGGTLAYSGSSQGAINAGTYGLSASGLTSGNYTINYTAGTLNVGKAALTVSASDASKSYDGLAFNGGNGVTYAGFVNGETSSVLGGTLAYSGSSQGAINAGTYGLSASGLTSGNYAIGYNAGILRVSPRNILVTSQSLDRPWGTPNPQLTYTVSGQGLVVGDSLIGALNTSATVRSGPGRYAIERGTLSSSANYSMDFVPGVLTIQSPFARQPVSVIVARYPSVALKQSWPERSLSGLDLISNLGCTSQSDKIQFKDNGLEVQQSFEFCAGGVH